MAIERQMPAANWQQELIASLQLAWPLMIAQLAQMLLFTTDVVMMGWLGPEQLAGGSLATALLHPLFVGSVGVVTATAPMIAQALGARDGRSVRRTVRQGFWVSIALSVVTIPLLLNLKPVFLALGQDPAATELATKYLSTAAFVVLPGLLFIVLRSLLQARGASTVILVITIAGIFVNALGNYALMFGNFGFPRLELAGAGLSTVLVDWVMFGLALVFVLRHRRFRRYHILVRFWKPDWHRFFEIFRIGLPIGLTLVSEVGLFGVAVVMMGWLGTDEVAAHAVAMQCAALSFMVPLGLSQATVVRVGWHVGAGLYDGVGRAAWVSLGMTLAFMSCTCLLFLLAPGFLVGLFLDPSLPENRNSLMLAAGYLGIAALFQLVDGAQVIMSAALRGMSDTRTPMFLAVVSYWAVGLSVAYVCGFVFDMRGIGIWLGLATSLAVAAILLTTRFAMRERLGLLQRANVAIIRS